MKETPVKVEVIRAVLVQKEPDDRYVSPSALTDPGIEGVYRITLLVDGREASFDLVKVRKSEA